MKQHFSWYLVLLLIALFAFFCTGYGLSGDFGNDDVMNLTFAWLPRLSALLSSLLSPFSAFYRPTGALIYRLLFVLCGLHPLPFRAFTYLLLTVNLGLVYLLARRLFSSDEVAAVASLLFAFHGRLGLIYSNNGAIYDVLCATISLLLLIFYVEWRLRRPALNWERLVILGVLFILALNAKEMAASIPLLLLLFEVLYRERPIAGHGANIRLFAGRCLPALFGLLIAAIAFRAKTSAGSAMRGNPAYALTLTFSQFFRLWRALMGDLFYAGERGLTTLEVVAIWVSMIGLAALFRKKSLWWALGFSLISPLPIIFIPYRHFFVMYFPLAGWAMFAAAVIVFGRDWLLENVWRRPPLGPTAFEPERLVLLLILAVVIHALPKSDPLSVLAIDDRSQGRVRQTIADLVRLQKPLPKAASILFLHDRFPPGSFGAPMVARLVYRDRELAALTPSILGHSVTPEEMKDFDVIFDYQEDRLFIAQESERSLRGRISFLPRP